MGSVLERPPCCGRPGPKPGRWQTLPPAAPQAAGPREA
jgi:hypothetical protein